MGKAVLTEALPAAATVAADQAEQVGTSSEVSNKELADQLIRLQSALGLASERSAADYGVQAIILRHMQQTVRMLTEAGHEDWADKVCIWVCQDARLGGKFVQGFAARHLGVDRDADGQVCDKFGQIGRRLSEKGLVTEQSALPGWLNPAPGLLPADLAKFGKDPQSTR